MSIPSTILRREGKNGMQIWNANKQTILGEIDEGGGNVRIAEEQDGTVLITCEIDLPSKFSELMKQGEE